MAEAWRLAQRGQALAFAGEARAALEQVRRAHELSSDPKLLFQAGQLEQELGNFARATLAFEQFLTWPGPVLKSERAAAVRLLRQSSASTARLNLQTNVQGAEIELEGQRGVASGAGFVAYLLLDAGERRIALSKPGYETRTLTVELEPGEVRSLRVDLDKAVGGRSETKPGKPRWALFSPTRPVGVRHTSAL